MYPHEYINNFNRSLGDKLPDRREFYSSLKDKYVSEKDYFHAVNVWNAFKKKTMGDYHDLYLKTEDVILLADVLEKFIGVSLKYYGLDPCHYFNSPESSWDAMLKMTSVELELNSDIEMYLFVEKGIRRGISSIAKRYSKTNNKYMESCDISKLSRYITFLDANNLCGWIWN